MRSTGQSAGLQFGVIGRSPEMRWKVETANVELSVLDSCVHSCVLLICVWLSSAGGSYLGWPHGEIGISKCEIGVVLKFPLSFQSPLE